jgi:hypothetical protein
MLVKMLRTLVSYIECDKTKNYILISKMIVQLMADLEMRLKKFFETKYQKNKPINANEAGNSPAYLIEAFSMKL